MPKLWTETMEAHRRAVRDATLDAAAALVAEHGPASVTMSQIAERTGIGRATLYKYFRDVDAILVAWHERQINAHLEQLARVRERPGDATERLVAVLEAYAFIQHQRRRHGGELATLMHQGEHVARAQRRLIDLIADLLAEGASGIRNDVPPAELAAYCLHALTTAAALPSKAAVRRLVTVVLAGLHLRP